MSLLDDVSIVVTPNGYKAGELYAVVPVPTEGAEEVTNGDFATDSDWIKGANWTIANNLATSDGSQTGNVSLKQLNSLTNLTIGTNYRVQFTISGYVSGVINPHIRGIQSGNVSGNGTKTSYIIAGNGSDGINLYAGSTFVGSISDVSIKEAIVVSADMDVTRATAATRVDENGLVNYAEIVTGSDIVTNGDFANGSTDWTLQNGWALGSNDMAFTPSASSYRKLFQENFLTIGNHYKLSFEIKSISAGSIANFESNSPSFNTIGVKTQIFTATFDDLYLEPTTDANLTIDNISVKEVTRDNVPRIDYSGGGCPHILAEPQRTNLYPHSDNSSTWSKSNFTTTDNYATSPDGTTNAFRGVSTSNASLLYIGSTGSAGTNTISIYAKSNTASDQKFRFFGNGNTTQSSDQTVTQEWQRFEYTETFSFITWGLLGASVSGTNDILFYGMQHEVGSYPTSMIPTSGSTVTRNQDQFSRDGIGSLINSTEGVLFLEMAALSNDLTTRIISLSDGTNTNRIHCFYYSVSNTIGLNYRVAGSTVASITASLGDETDFKKIAFRWESGNFKLYVDGVSMGTDTNTTMLTANTLSELAFNQGGGASNFFGKVKQLQVYKTALTDEQLIQLTGESGTDFYESYAEMASALTYTIQ